MRIIFLDVDEVLSNNRTWYANGEVAQPSETGCKHLDTIGLKMLGHLCADAGAKIVLSSTWRKHISGIEFGKNTGLQVIDQTPVTGKQRGYDIKEWLDAHTDVESYVIIDDSCDMLPDQMPNLVRVDKRFGITFENIEEAHILLTGELL